ncbi:hypothetical protein L5515_015376 [Caenorhabditis briggsae]|uniref:Homeobox domain-containing protein n=1 Tax=Caenorhabditis briggsae TaxID=6238 RepID=A0AAE9EE04_CAEBR|nr:hypothetical protein L5515_015376 [Caenorhabditis briggsae]
MPSRRVERPRKDTTSHQGTSEGIALKRRRVPDSSASESERDVQELRPKRNSARHVIYNEHDSDFEDSSDSDDTVVEKTENEQIQHSQKRKRNNYTEEQREILHAMLSQTHNPSEEQRKKLAEETNLSTRQVRKWFDNKRQENPEWVKARESNPEWVKRREGILSGEKKLRMEQVFAINRRPDKETIAALVSELGITKEKVEGWFSTKRYRNPIAEEVPLLLCEEDAKPILMEFFKRNPNFRDYKNAELKEKTGWPRHRLREFFETCRQENGIVDSQLTYDKAEPILRQILVEDPLFSDYQNVELKGKIHWSSRKVEEWFRRQRHLKKQNQFTTAMETFFQTQQFLEKPNKALESESGGTRRRIFNWLENKRKTTLESFLKKEIMLNEMPKEMATFERLYEKYDAPTDEDVILYIEKKENVSGDSFTVYLVERWTVVKKLQPGDVNAGEDDFADPLDEEYPNDPEFDYQMNEHQEEDDMESEGYEIGTPDEALLDEDVKDITLFGNPREDYQRPPIVNHIKNEVDDFGDETQNMPRFVPAPGYRDQSQELDVEEKFIRS